ncbi:MAG: hypothetical protein EA360_01885 [Balneolaceae bacterium]|nr:MAG: hypothetical protein EA360_01885 [Balneolaceae bacterium]
MNFIDGKIGNLTLFYHMAFSARLPEESYFAALRTAGIRRSSTVNILQIRIQLLKRDADLFSK